MAPADGTTAASANVLDIQGLRKRFETHEVLTGLDWSVSGGRVIGLLGRNGAGKTTLLRCIAGLSLVDAGDISVLGQSMDEPGGERLQQIGFVPQTFDLFPWMKVHAYLDFMAAFYPRWDKQMVERLLDNWQIRPKQKIGQLSQGQRQKLAIIRALAPDPALLLLDEPVASLDPQARRAFMDELMRVVQRPGKTVVFSTHITADLERAGADIALLKDGRIVLESALPHLRGRVRQATFTRTNAWQKAPLEAGVLRSDIDGAQVRVIVDGVSDDTLRAAADRERAELAIQPLSLEDVFVEMA